jgi:hypothetical protein
MNIPQDGTLNRARRLSSLVALWTTNVSVKQTLRILYNTNMGKQRVDDQQRREKLTRLCTHEAKQSVRI